MARTTGPLMSLDASGSVASTIVFSKWKGRNYVRQLVIPANPQSGLQVGVRALITFASQYWKTGVSDAHKATWNTLAAQQKISPFNAYIQVNGARNRAGTGFTPVNPPVTAAGEAAPTAGTATAAYRSLSVAWTDSVGANDTATYIYSSTVTGFTPGPDTLIAIIAHGVEKYIQTNLASGVAVYYRLQGVDNTGNLGSLLAQFTGTPN